MHTLTREEAQTAISTVRNGLAAQPISINQQAEIAALTRIAEWLSAAYFSQTNEGSENHDAE